MKWYLKVLRQYVDFSGRARRTEYWMFVLFNIIFAAVAMTLDNVIGSTFDLTAADGSSLPIAYGYIYLLYTLFVLIPGLAVMVRRLHDVGKSGWMAFILLIPIVGAVWMLILLVSDSVPGSNKWGDNPKETTGDNMLAAG
jgi:uncharacterized membrane protein YhaH (DUF805 family)